MSKVPKLRACLDIGSFEVSVKSGKCVDIVKIFVNILFFSITKILTYNHFKIPNIKKGN